MILSIDRQEQRARYASQNYTGSNWKGNIVTTNTVTVPDHVIAERDHRATLVPRDTTALRMGDPLPGYSAAERAPSIVASIYRDPLDALIFGRKRSGSRTGARYG